MFTTFHRSLAQSRRLVCFPYAGGGANQYRDWAGQIPDTDVIAAQLAGRDGRFFEPMRTDFAALCADLVEALEPFVDTEIALFGHSLGGLIAFEVGRSLLARGHAPALVIVAGCAAPGVIATAPRRHDLSNDALRAELAATGVPPEVLQDDQLMQLTLPAFRADLEVQDSYQVDPSAQPFDRPVQLYYGVHEARDPERLRRGWAEVASGPIGLTSFPGGHFFVNSAQTAVLRAISHDIALTMDAR